MAAKEEASRLASSYEEAGPYPGPGHTLLTTDGPARWVPLEPGAHDYWAGAMRPYQFRIGPKMRAVADFALAHPGASVSQVLRGAGVHPNWFTGPEVIWRAEAAGLVVIERVRSNLYRVFPAEQAREEWNQAGHSAEWIARLPRVRALMDVVSGMPGCSKTRAMVAADVPAFTLDQAAACGLILVDANGRRTHLFANERDRKIFYLRRELRRPGTSADRIAELQAEIDTLRAEAAQTWTEA